MYIVLHDARSSDHVLLYILFINSGISCSLLYHGIEVHCCHNSTVNIVVEVYTCIFSNTSAIA